MKKNGFTLIELLAVIVILAIIAVISVPIILNVIEKSRIGSAESSALGYIDAVEKQISINLLDKELVEIKEGTYTVEELENLGVIIKGIKPNSGEVTITTKVENATICIRNYKVEYKNNKATAKKDINCDNKDIEDEIIKDPDSKKPVNTPQLSEGMKPIKWDNNNNEIETNENDPEWYDYEQSKWANVKTKDGSYFVWVPRYAYKITSGYHTSTAGTIDIKFLKGPTDTTEDETKIETNGYISGSKDTSMHYFTHPAFTFGTDELEGFWVAKFEPSGTANNINVLPNVNSIRSMKIGDQFDAALNMKNNSKYGWNNNEVDTHMMKNTEWSAVAYLAQSKYGANREIWKNNSSTYITGCAGNTVAAAGQSGCQNQYNTANGVKASTTHNITGIYDMNGGSWEYLAAYIDNNNGNLKTNGQSILSATSKYKNIYKIGTTDAQSNNYIETKNLYGDGIYETTINGTSSTGAWYTKYSYMPYKTYPWIYRGGRATNTQSGLFAIHSDVSGGSYNYITFRPIVVIN